MCEGLRCADIPAGASHTTPHSTTQMLQPLPAALRIGSESPTQVCAEFPYLFRQLMPLSFRHTQSFAYSRREGASSREADIGGHEKKPVSDGRKEACRLARQVLAGRRGACSSATGSPHPQFSGWQSSRLSEVLTEAVTWLEVERAEPAQTAGIPKNAQSCLGSSRKRREARQPRFMPTHGSAPRLEVNPVSDASLACR